MPPSRRWIEVIFCVSNDLKTIDIQQIIHKIPSLWLNEIENKIVNEVPLLLLSQNNDLIVQNFIENALTNYYEKIQKTMINLANDQCKRREESEKNGLKLPLFPRHSQLAPSHVYRKDLVINILDKFRELNNSHGMVLVHGMGGAGKTSLCNEIMQTDEAEDFFSGGVLMITIGQKAHESLHKENLIKIYNHLLPLRPLDEIIGSDEKLKNSIKIDNNSQAYDYTIAIQTITANLFIPKVLIILNEVWDEKDLRPYDQLGLFCLVTSRKSHILNGIRDQFFKFSIPTGFTENHSKQFWNTYFGDMQPFSVEFTRITNYLSRLCQSSPLALNLIASSVKCKGNYRQSINKQLWQILLTMKANSSGLVFCMQSIFTPVIESIKVSLSSMNINNRKLLGEKYSAEEKYNYLVLFDDSTAISKRLLMILWNLESIEAVKMDLQLFLNHSLITLDQSSSPNVYSLHYLHMAFLRNQNWPEIRHYRKECIDKIRLYCDEKWFLLDHKDGNLWKILFQCCKILYKKPDDFPPKLLTDLRVWNAYARARGLTHLYEEMKRCIQLSSTDLQKQLKEFLVFIQRLPNELVTENKFHDVNFEFEQNVLITSNEKTNSTLLVPGNYYFQNQEDNGDEARNNNKPFLWTITVGLDKDIVFQWQCDCYCVDYERSVVYAGYKNGVIERLTRNRITNFQIDVDGLENYLDNIVFIESSNLIAVQIKNQTTKSIRYEIYKGKTYKRLVEYCEPLSQITSFNCNEAFHSANSMEFLFNKFHKKFLLLSTNNSLLTLNLTNQRKSFGKPQKVNIIENDILSFLTINNQLVLLISSTKLTLFNLFTNQVQKETLIVEEMNCEKERIENEECLSIYAYPKSKKTFSSSWKKRCFALITSFKIKIYDECLTLMKEEEVSDSPETSIQYFMKETEPSLKRIKVYNVIRKRFEVHYSPKWKGATNVLSNDAKKFTNLPACNYFSPPIYQDKKNVKIPFKEINRQSTMKKRDKNIEKETDQQVNMKRVLTCEHIQDSNGKDIIWVLCTDAKEFHDLKVFVFDYSTSSKDPLSIASFYQENISGMNAGINFNLIWVTDWKPDNSQSVTLQVAYLDLEMMVENIPNTQWNNFKLRWKKPVDTAECSECRPYFRINQNNNVEQPKVVSMFLCHSDGIIDIFVLKQGEQVKTYQLEYNDSFPCDTMLWRFSGSFIIKITKQDEVDEEWKNCNVDHFDLHMDTNNNKWLMKKLEFSNKSDLKNIKMACCSCNKRYAFSFSSEKTQETILKIYSGTEIYTEIYTESFNCDENIQEIIFYHLDSENTCILAVNSFNKLHAILIHENNTVNVYNVDDKFEGGGDMQNIYFSLCGKYILMKNCLDCERNIYHTLSMENKSLTIVNDFMTSKNIHIAAMGNDKTVFVLVNKAFFI